MNIENINVLFLYKNYISDEYHEKLIKFINDQPWNESLSRRTHIMDIYMIIVKNKKHKVLLQLKTNIESLPMFNNIKFDQYIVNEYFPGQDISPHVDHITQFGPIVVSLSLDSPCTFQFISNNTVLNYNLEAKELCVMSKDARYFWKHSITFRSIKN